MVFFVKVPNQLDKIIESLEQIKKQLNAPAPAKTQDTPKTQNTPKTQDAQKTPTEQSVPVMPNYFVPPYDH
jgi:hypothetical protein